MRTETRATGYRWSRCSQCGKEIQTPKRFGIYDLMTLLCRECHDGPWRIMAIQNAVFDGKGHESAKRKLSRWAEATARQQAERILDTKFYDNTRGSGPDFISTTSGIKVGLEVTAIMPVNIQARLRTDGLSPMEDMSRVMRLIDAPMVVKSMMGRFGGCAASSGIGWRGGGCGLGRVRVLRCDWGGFRRLGRSG